MNKRMIVMVAMLLIVLVSGCTQIPGTVSVKNIPPVIAGIRNFHRPSEHSQYEYSVYAIGADEDGSIVSWVIRINGETFRVGTPDGRQSEIVTYKFDFPGTYQLSVTAFDDDGAQTSFTPEGGWEVK